MKKHYNITIMQFKKTPEIAQTYNNNKDKIIRSYLANILKHMNRLEEPLQYYDNAISITLNFIKQQLIKQLYQMIQIKDALQNYDNQFKKKPEQVKAYTNKTTNQISQTDLKNVKTIQTMSTNCQLGLKIIQSTQISGQVMHLNC